MSKFRQRDLTRAIRAATKAGLSNFRIEISPLDGKIVISTGLTQNEDLDRELAEFEASK